MPSQEFVFTVKLPINVVWSFMNDRAEVGRLFPGCKKVTILNDLDSIWTVEFSLGPFSRTIEMQGHTAELMENERIAWTATHEHLVTAGTITFRQISRGETEITYRLEARVIGHFAFLQDIIMAEKLGELSRIFMKNIKERLAREAERRTEEA